MFASMTEERPAAFCTTVLGARIFSAVSLVVLVGCMALIEERRIAASIGVPISSMIAFSLLFCTASIAVLMFAFLRDMDTTTCEAKMTIRAGCAQPTSLFESIGLIFLSQQQISDGRQLFRFQLQNAASGCLPKVSSDVMGEWRLVKHNGMFEFAFTPHCNNADYMFSLSLLPIPGRNRSAPAMCSGYSRTMPRTLLLAA